MDMSEHVDFEEELKERQKTEKERAKLWSRRDVDIDYIGNKITLPNDPAKMPLRTAIAALERKAKDEETELDVHEIIDAYPEDALVAFNLAMRQKYGWASPIPKMTWFGPVAPDLITVKTGPKATDQVQVPYGQFTLPGVENPIMTHRMPQPNGQWVLVVTGTVRKREAAVVKELANLTREILKTSSIYKGQAIRLRSTVDGQLDMSSPPEYIDTDGVKPAELVLNQDALDVVEHALWAPIQHTQACLEHKIPLKRGILLEGPYGTGKTMTAAVTSKVCVNSGWTYILLDDVRSLRDALLFAQRYAPAVIFAEDIDRVAETRDQQGNDLLNTIDGVLSKNSQVITVLTTNHVEKVNQAMLRPGRLDAVISIKAPDAEAVQKLLRIYGRTLIAKSEKLDRIGEQLAGNIPATVREVVERSKLGMIANNRKSVTEEDLIVAATGMAYHLELLKGKPDEPSDEHKLGAAMVTLINERIIQKVEGDGEQTRQTVLENC